MQVNTNVYNYLSTSLVPKKRNTTHKSSELREVYSNMARYNKNSPLFLLNMSEEKQSHIINIKEAALTLKDVADNFGNTSSAIYQKKSLHSDNEDAVSGAFRPKAKQDTLPSELSVDIHSLATEQINIGYYLNPKGHGLKPGNYSFTANTFDNSIGFSIQVAGDDSNLDIQEKIVSSINQKNSGMTASLVSDGEKTAVIVSSNTSGAPGTPDGLHFSFENARNDRNLVDTFGLNNVTTIPANSEFSINGTTHTSSSNHISINQLIELDFHQTTKSPVKISFIPDQANALEQVENFISAYNSLVDLAGKEAKANVGSRNLSNDISNIVKKHLTDLESAGLTIREDNRMEKDDDKIMESIKTGAFSDLFKDLSSFRSDMEKTTQRLTIDPMAYVNKLLVTYPNTKNKLNSSYTQSIYSGLMYNNYA